MGEYANRDETTNKSVGRGWEERSPGGVIGAFVMSVRSSSPLMGDFAHNFLLDFVDRARSHNYHTIS
jgi:hypothetical protein